MLTLTSLGHTSGVWIGQTTEGGGSECNEDVHRLGKRDDRHQDALGPRPRAQTCVFFNVAVMLAQRTTQGLARILTLSVVGLTLPVSLGLEHSHERDVRA